MKTRQDTLFISKSARAHVWEAKLIPKGSQNSWCWKGISDRLVQHPYTEQGHSEWVALGHVQSAFEYLQGWALLHLSGQPGPEFKQMHSRKKKCKSLLFSSLNNPGLSSFPSMSDAPNHQLSLWSFAGFTLISPFLSYTGEAGTGHSTPNVPCQVWPVGSVLPNAVQDAIVHFCSEGTLLTHVQLLH